MEDKNIDSRELKDDVKKVDELDSKKISGGILSCRVCGSTSGSMRSSEGLCGNCLSQGYGYCKDCGKIQQLNPHGHCSQCARHYGYSRPRHS